MSSFFRKNLLSSSLFLALIFLTPSAQATVSWGETINAGSTQIKAVHINEIRDSINDIIDGSIPISGAGKWIDGATAGEIYYNTGNVGIGIANPNAKLDVSGTIQTNTQILSGVGGGGVGLTVNDGYGNANVTFNHAAGRPEQNGNAGRIEVNTDSLSDARMYFELGSGVTANVPGNINNVMTLKADGTVGIGITNPTTRLTIDNLADVSAANAGGDILIQESSSATAGRKLRIDDNEMQSSNDNVASALLINPFGGNVVVGDATSELDVVGILEVGPNASVSATTEVAEIRKDFTADANHTQLTINPTIGNAVLTANRSNYGVNVSMTNNQDGSTGGDYSYGYGVRGYVNNSGTAGRGYYNAGGTFEGRNNSTNGMVHARGVVGVARQYDDDGGSTVNYAYGVEAQALGRSSSSTNPGNIIHARGLTATTYPYSSNITNADGVNGYISTNNGHGGNITTAYGVRGSVRNDSDDGSDITNAFGGHFSTSKRASANNIGTAYGVYANAVGGNTNYGVYSAAGTNYFAEQLDIAGGLILGETSDVGIGPDILMTSRGLIAAEDKLWLNIDADNDSTDANFKIKKDSENGSGTDIFTVFENGNVEAIGSMSATEYCDETGANCVAAADLGGSGGSSGGGTTLAQHYRDAGTLVPTPPAGIEDWPDYLICRGGTRDFTLYLEEIYDNGSLYYDSGYGGTVVRKGFTNTGANATSSVVAANCGSSGTDIVSICNDGRCGFLGGGGSGSGSGSGGSTMVDGWPDAIRCEMTSPNWDMVTFYLQYTPFNDGRYWYRTIQSSGDYSFKFNADGSFYESLGFTSPCDNKSITQLYADGEAFNFGGGSGGGGVTGTWTDVTASRPKQVWHQNTSGGNLAVSYRSNYNAPTVHVSPTGTSTDQVVVTSGDGDSGEHGPGFLIVPAGHYYKFSSGGSMLHVSELELGGGSGGSGGSSLWTESGGNVSRPTGYVGIGVSTPTVALELTDVGNTVGTTVRLNSTSTGGGDYGIQSSSPTADTGAGFFRIYDYTTDLDRLVINPSGNVGIGTDAPTQKLHVTGGVRVGEGNTNATYDGLLPAHGGVLFKSSGTQTRAAAIYQGNGSGAAGGLQVAAGYNGIQFATGTTPVSRMFIASDGNVGIGTTTPNQKLTVEGDITSGGSNTWQFHTPDDGRRTLYFGTASSTSGARAWPVSFGNTGVVSATTFRSTAANANDVVLEYEAGADLIRQSSARGGIQLSAKDDSFYIGNGDVAKNLNATYFNPESEIVGIGSDSHIYLFSDLQEGWGTQNTAVFTNAGRFGIGTASPQAALHVASTADLGLATTDHGLTVGSHTAGNIGIDGNEIMARNNGAKASLHLNVEGGDVTIHNSPPDTNTRVIFKDNGYVGIGTNAPTHKLDVRGPIRNDHTSSTYDVWIQGASATSGDNRNLAILGVDEDSGDRLLINYNGEYAGGVGIGVTSVSSGLELDVGGKVGATEYCDQNGANCVPASQIASASCTLGVNQTWQNLTSSRSRNVWYRNTTGRPIMVAIHTNTPDSFAYVSTTASGGVQVSGHDGASGTWNNSHFIVPHNHYYRSTGSTHRYWSELRGPNCTS